MAAAGGEEKKKNYYDDVGNPKLARKIFRGDIMKKAPIIFASAHGVYYLDNDTAPIPVPENMYIFETNTIGDYTSTNIDEPLWDILQGNNRAAFIAYLSGNMVGRAPDADEIQYFDVVKALRFYKPGDMIYPRELSIGGGRLSDLKGSARRTFANMGFYRFELGKIDKFPDGPESRILQPLRTELIRDEYKSITYPQLFEYIYKSDPGLRDGVILVVSACAEARPRDASVTKRMFDAKIEAVEKQQRAQDLQFLSISPMGEGGPGFPGLDKIQAEANAEAAAGAPKGRGAAAAAESAVFGREGLRHHTGIFHKSAFGSNNAPFRMLANKDYGEREVSPHEAAAAAPAGTKAVFMVPKGAGKGNYTQVFSKEGLPFLTDEEIRKVRRKFKRKLYEFKDGKFVLIPRKADEPAVEVPDGAVAVLGAAAAEPGGGGGGAAAVAAPAAAAGGEGKAGGGRRRKTRSHKRHAKKTRRH